jgi:exo-beta-1,3-glucanase (GH17 family)
MIDEVRTAAPGVPVGYVDAYFQFAQHPALVEACDFLPINCYPFWEKCPIEQAVPYAAEMVRRVQAVADGKPVIIAETGWPSEGPSEGAAEPGFDNMVLYALNLIEWAEESGVELFWFSAFDEAWKVGAEGGAGAYWGLWTADGRFKLA